MRPLSRFGFLLTSAGGRIQFIGAMKLAHGRFASLIYRLAD